MSTELHCYRIPAERFRSKLFTAAYSVRVGSVYTKIRDDVAWSRTDGK